MTKTLTESPTESRAGPLRRTLSATAGGLRRYCEYAQVLVEHDGRPGRARREPRRVEVGADRRHAVGALQPDAPTRCGTRKPWIYICISCKCRRVAARCIIIYISMCPARVRSRAGRLRSADALPPVGCGHAGANNTPQHTRSRSHTTAAAAGTPSFLRRTGRRWRSVVALPTASRATPRSASGNGLSGNSAKRERL